MLPRAAAVAQPPEPIGPAGPPNRKDGLDERSTIKDSGAAIMTSEFRHDLAEMELPELEQALDSMGHPRFHARQLYRWVHKRGVTDFVDMTDISRELRASTFRTPRRTRSAFRRRWAAR